MAVAAILLALASALPAAPHPAPPFPKMLTDAPAFSDVAPGVHYGDYEMRTADGPLSVHVLAIDLRDPTVRIGTALAHDRLVSSGETVSSMALRSQAVAGVNGDYFDINQTNQPLNLLISAGRLIRMPMQRWALGFDAQKDAFFDEFHISASVRTQTGIVPLKTINDWPPPGGGAVLVTPEYGPLRALDDVSAVALEPITGTPPFATYRVSAQVDPTQPLGAGYYLAGGPQAFMQSALPALGETISIEQESTPSIAPLQDAIGGGPLLVRNGAWYADPDGPSKGEFATHMPATAAAITADGTLLLFEVDGRQPSLSVGVLQPQLASLLIAFGAVTGMQFDGGGSSTIVARLPGDRAAQVQNVPSDGTERRVGDALFVYSDAPYGAPARVYSFPQVVRAMPGARVPLRIAVTDAGGHDMSACCAAHLRVIPQSAGSLEGSTFVAGNGARSAAIRIDAGTLHADIPVAITTQPARTEILPAFPAVLAHETLQLRARAFDARGYPIALPETLPWTASAGSIDRHGMFVAPAADTRVSVALGAASATQTITVGEHDALLPLSRYAQFATVPHTGPGALQRDAGCAGCLRLTYDFTGTQRAAYANASIPLPGRTLAIAADVDGDANGETLRFAVTNAINERFLYTLARIDWHGWRRVEFRLPDALAQPVTFKSLYVINRVGPGAASKAAGSITIRDARAVLAGSSQSGTQ